jgi:hypothetical protein
MSVRGRVCARIFPGFAVPMAGADLAKTPRMSTRSLRAVLAVFLVLSGCAASSADPAPSQEDALETASSTRSYTALAGTWKALDRVPPASADGIPSYTTYTFSADGTFQASRGTTTVSGTWQIFTTLPDLPRLDMTFLGTRETYVFSLQSDLLVLDGIDALFGHDVESLPEVADGARCEDAWWNSVARCPEDIGACDHETHRCLQPS